MALALPSAVLAAPLIGAGSRASQDVPLDSWVYAAFDRLAAEGYAPSAYFSLRPWTRLECARLVEAAEAHFEATWRRPAQSGRPLGPKPQAAWGTREALPASEARRQATHTGAPSASARWGGSGSDQAKNGEPLSRRPGSSDRRSDVPGLLASLRREFSPELQRPAGSGHPEVRLESLDQRLTAIAGQPLTDGYHFAETLVDDDGRPFAEGMNLYTGISVRASAGPFAAYVRTEVQRAPLAPGPGAAAQRQIAIADFTPAAAAGPVSGILRGRVLEASVSFMAGDNRFTLGRQSLWWGPARSGATLFSDNAEPIDMIRYDRARPFVLPGLFKRLGPMRIEAMVGRLAGAQFSHPAGAALGTSGVALDDQPFIHGEKIAFKPTPNLELSVSRTVVFGGVGAPVTAATFLRSEFSFATGNGARDPGDRRGAIDAEYRIPKLRNCLTGYLDGFSDDLALPVVEPTQNTWLFGLFLRCVPKLPRWTVRIESLTAPHRDGLFPGFFYFNVHYLSGYTNNRQLIGSWIGREGEGGQAWVTWNLSPRSSVEVSGRRVAVHREFLEGGSLQDLSATVDVALRPDWQLRLREQAEWWRFPLLAASGRRDAALTMEISYRPVGGARP